MTTLIETGVKDRRTGKEAVVVALIPSRPPLGLVPTALANTGALRKISMPTSGLDLVEALARAQGLLDASSDDG